MNHDKTERRKRKVRSSIVGKSAFPRLSVHRSNRYIYAQVIDDKAGHMVASASEKDIKVEKGMTKSTRAEEVGKVMGEKLKKLKIKQVVFDRGQFKYAGRVKAVAEGVRSTEITI